MSHTVSLGVVTGGGHWGGCHSTGHHVTLVLAAGAARHCTRLAHTVAQRDLRATHGVVCAARGPPSDWGRLVGSRSLTPLLHSRPLLPPGGGGRGRGLASAGPPLAQPSAGGRATRPPPHHTHLLPPMYHTRTPPRKPLTPCPSPAHTTHPPPPAPTALTPRARLPLHALHTTRPNPPARPPHRVPESYAPSPPRARVVLHAFLTTCPSPFACLPHHVPESSALAPTSTRAGVP